MPRTSRMLMAEKAERPTGLVAAATNMSVGQPATRRNVKQVSHEAWQSAAWGWLDQIGEYRYSVNWVGNVLSKATLHVTKNGKECKEQPALDAMASFYDGAEGQAEMLRNLGIHFTVAGEAYIMGESQENGEEDQWLVAAAARTSRSTAGNWKVGTREFRDPLVIRMWLPHPLDADLSTSPSRAILNILAEIDGLTKHVAAQIDSRLAGAGLLLLPSEITFAATPGSETDENEAAPNADSFMRTLIDSMQTAIGNREDASALVPIIIQAAGEHLDKIKHVTFSTPLDEKAIELRAEAIRRLALGMDMPPEILTGTADLNHWGSWQVEEASIKAHTEPLLAVITSSLTKGYLRPALLDMGVPEEDILLYAVAADTSKMRLRPNRSEEALELYDRGELDGDTLRRENGFEIDSKMDDKELAVWFARKVASGSTTPELVEAALRSLGVDLPVLNRPTETVQVQEARPTPSLKEHPDETPPDTLDDAAVAAAEVMVFRALERAGNRLKTKHGGTFECAAADIYLYVPPVTDAQAESLLMDAWGLLPRFGYRISAQSMNVYTKSLLTDGRKHDREILRGYLSARAVLEGTLT